MLRKLKTYGESYHICELKLVDVVVAFKIWRLYPYGGQFEMCIECKNLKFLF